MREPTGPVLVLDGALPTVEAGLLDGEHWVSRTSSEAPPLAAFAALLPELLGGLEHPPAGIAVGVGPGSQLGTRLAAMSAEGLRIAREAPPILLGFRSFDVAAANLLSAGVARPFRLLMAFRARAWLHYDVEGSEAIENLPDLALMMSEEPEEPVASEGRTYRLPQRKTWRKETSKLPLAPASLAETQARTLRRLWRPIETIATTLPDAPEYVKWSGKRHRSPV